MLQVFRKHRKGIFATVAACFVAVLMVGFGMEGVFTNPSSATNTAITVNGNEISFREYSENYERLNNYYRSQYKENFENFRQFLNLEQQTIDGLVAREILKDLQDELGLKVSTKQIEDEIKNNPSFASQLKDKASFKDYLNQIGLTSARLEAVTREQLEGSQLQRILEQLTFVSKKELEKSFFEKNKEMAFYFLEYKAEDFKEQVDTSDENKLLEFYEETKKSYEKPRSVKYNFLRLKPSDYFDNVDYTDEDIEIAYREEKSKFFEPKKVRVQQIIISKAKEEDNKEEKLEELFEEEANEEDSRNGETLPSPADPNQEKRELLETVLARLDGGEDFKEVANEVSEKKEAIDLGLKTLDQLDPGNQNAIADLDLGENSEIIETDDEFKIVRLAEIIDRKTKPLEEVKDQLVTKIKNDNAPVYMIATAEALFTELQDSGRSLVDFAAEKGKEAIELDKLFAANETIPGVTSGLTAKVLPLALGEKELIEIQNEAYIVEVTETKDAYVPEFSVVKDDVMKNYKAKESIVLAKKQAENALLGLQEAKDIVSARKAIKDFAEANGLELKETELSTQTGLQERFLTAENTKREVFTLSKENPVAANTYQFGGSEYVVVLKQEKLADPKKFEEEIEALKGTYEAQVQSRLLNAIVASLKAKADVEVDASLIDNKPSAI